MVNQTQTVSSSGPSAYSLGTDYMGGAHPRVLEALTDTNLLRTPGYGGDSFCEEAATLIRQACQAPEAEVRFLVGGTQTNMVALSSLLAPYQGVIAAETGHISGHEAGAIEAGGHKVLALPARDGKLTAQAIAACWKSWEQDETREHVVMPGAVYLSQPTESGTVTYIQDDGSREELIGKDPLTISNLGVTLSFVPEDRLGMGLVGNMDISANMMLRSFRDGRSAFLNRKDPRRLAEKVVEDLEVVTPDIGTPVRKLSGGNIQKILVGREISSSPKVLLTAYAVRGLDTNSSYTIYDLINKQKQNGVAVVYVGEDLDVLLELSDRILVLCDGKVSGIVDGRKAEKNRIGMMMTKLGGEG